VTDEWGGSPVAYMQETSKSRKWSRDAATGSLTRSWVCWGTSDLSEVLELALANNALYFAGGSRKSVKADPMDAPDLWAVEVEYGASALPDGLKPDEMAFRITAQNVHVTQSKETKFRRTSADNALGATDVGTGANYQQAIGVTLTDIQGVDIQVPRREFTISTQRPTFDWPYYRAIGDLVAKTNKAAFLGFPAGTLLYLGAEPTSGVGTLDSGAKFGFWNLAHHFLYEPNQTNLSIGGITIPRKNGHEYVWARYGAAITAGRVGQRPDAVYVERVYDEGDYDALELVKGGGDGLDLLGGALLGGNTP
jgi:hypothetical protein